MSQITIRNAIALLAKEGLVYDGYFDGKRGTIVRSRDRVAHYPTDSIRGDRPDRITDSFEESAEKAGRTPSKRFTMRIATAPADVAHRLGVEPDALVVQRIVYQLLDGEPWSREVSYFARELAERTGVDTPHDLPQGSVRQLRDAGFPEVARADEVTDEVASPEDAADLSVATGAPLLVQTRTAAAAHCITRVTRIVRMGQRSRLVYDLGDPGALTAIRAATGTVSTDNEQPGQC